MFLPPALFVALAVMFYVGMQRENPDDLPSVFVGKAAPAHLPGAPWLLAALLLAIGWLVGWRFARPPSAAAH